MPDWTYHPLFRPFLFRLPAETGRRLTLALLDAQGRTAIGRAVFRLFGHVHPPPEVAVEAFGLRFPSPVGLAPGIDTHGAAVATMQYLGFGFLEVGPVGAAAVPRRRACDPLRIEERLAIAASGEAGGPAAAELAAVVRSAPALEIPVGLALRGPDLEAAVRDAEGAAAFLTLPQGAAPLAALRAATRKPLLLRLRPDTPDDELDRVVGAALDAGVDGFVATTGERTPLLPDGELCGPFLARRALALVERIAPRAPVIGCGGIASPADALAFLSAGAKLVELYDGLVYAGPGLPGRILHALEAPPASAPASAPTPAPPPPRALGWLPLTLTGLALVVSGVAYLVIAGTTQLLPPDEHFLGMTAAELARHYDGRIVHFMVHDRVSFGGSILAVGLLYLWLSRVPLRAGEGWSWWALLVSGVTGFLSFLTYLSYGYLDTWHAAATLLLLPVYLAGMILGWRLLRGPRGPSTLWRQRVASWTWSPAGRGRMCLAFACLGMVTGGLIIMTVGMTWVFVPQDLEFMGVTADQLRAVNPRLVSLIAHDRAGFGGGLFSGGLTIGALLVCGVRPGARGLWWALLGAGLSGFGCAIGIHPMVGYTSFVHLLPAYLGALAFLAGMWLLYRPMCLADPSPARRFPDL